jgi:hypothetical protein
MRVVVWYTHKGGQGGGASLTFFFFTTRASACPSAREEADAAPLLPHPIFLLCFALAAVRAK